MTETGMEALKREIDETRDTLQRLSNKIAELAATAENAPSDPNVDNEAALHELAASLNAMQGEFALPEPAPAPEEPVADTENPTA